MKTIIGLTIAFILAVGMIGVATFAYFSDTETSADNQLTAGTLDLKTDDADGVSETLYATNLAPGDTVGPSTIQLKNSGSVDGSTLDIEFSYVESDGSRNSVDKSANDTAAMMEVTTLSYGGSSLLSSVSDANVNGYKDIEDLKNEDLSGQSGINASVTKNFEIAVQLRSETGDDFQADGITLTMTFTLNQCGSGYDTSWQYRKAITFTSDTAKIPSTLTNFPVLINLSSDSDLAADAQDDGDDILFTSSNGTTKLDHEIEKFDGSTGELVAWVEVASLSTGTVIYMYYGNSGASSQQNATGTWDGNFKMVQHLKDLTTSTTKDSTSNNNNGTKGAANQPIEVNAKIGKGQDFTPTTQYLQIGTTGFSASSGTVELWAKAEGFVLADPAQYLFGHTINPGWSSRIQLYTDDTLGNLNLGLGDSHSTALDIQALNTATWYHIVLTWDGTNYVVYVDSVSKATGTYAGLTSIESFADIGNAGQALERIEAWNGIIDEVRVSNSVRSAAWIGTAYNNQSDPSAFYSMGAEE